MKKKSKILTPLNSELTNAIVKAKAPGKNRPIYQLKDYPPERLVRTPNHYALRTQKRKITLAKITFKDIKT